MQLESEDFYGDFSTPQVQEEIEQHRKPRLAHMSGNMFIRCPMPATKHTLMHSKKMTALISSRTNLLSQHCLANCEVLLYADISRSILQHTDFGANQLWKSCNLVEQGLCYYCITFTNWQGSEPIVPSSTIMMHRCQASGKYIANSFSSGRFLI